MYAKCEGSGEPVNWCSLARVFIVVCHTINEPCSEKNLIPYANNKGAAQPVHPHSLISIFVVCCLDSIIYLVSIFAIS